MNITELQHKILGHLQSSDKESTVIEMAERGLGSSNAIYKAAVGLVQLGFTKWKGVQATGRRPRRVLRITAQGGVVLKMLDRSVEKV